jgi:hypothetical protein
VNFAGGGSLQLAIANSGAPFLAAPAPSDYSQLSLVGFATATFTGGLLTANVAQPINQGDLFTVILNDGTASMTGEFANASFLISGSTYSYVSPSGQPFLVNYKYNGSLGDGNEASGITPAAFEAASGGNEVALLAVPEPNTGAALLAGLGSLIGLQRFRRRRS